MGLLERVHARVAAGDEQRFNLHDYQSLFFNYDGLNYQLGGLNMTYPGQRVAEVASTLPGYMQALASCPPAFGAQMVRALVLSQLRFVFRNLGRAGTPRRIWSSKALLPLEHPWRNATTGELISRMEWHAGLAGNAFAHRYGDEVRVLHPNRTVIVYGSQLDPEDPMWQIDATVVGYLYRPSGTAGGREDFLAPGDVAHWSPIPDPESPGLGMSWLTPAIRDMQGDRAATEHKLRYFTNGATPNLVVKGLPAKSKQEFEDLVDILEANHTGIRNAYRTLYLTAGADATVVGANLKDIDYKSVQGAGETRISMLSRVPAALLGISEGLAGSALNAGNFAASRRTFADTWVYPTAQDLCAALAPLIQIRDRKGKLTDDSELWFDTADVPLLREDGKDAADIAQVQATTIRTLIDAGYDPDSVITAVRANDWGLLKHSGLYSVQLQKPGAGTGSNPKPVPAPSEE